MRAHLTMRRLSLAIFAALNILDIMTTHAGLAAGIPEGNPVPALLLGGGEIGFFAVKVGLSLAVVGAILRLRQYPRLWAVLPVVSLVLAVAVVSNLAMIIH